VYEVTNVEELYDVINISVTMIDLGYDIVTSDHDCAVEGSGSTSQDPIYGSRRVYLGLY